MGGTHIRDKLLNADDGVYGLSHLYDQLISVTLPNALVKNVDCNADLLLLDNLFIFNIYKCISINDLVVSTYVMS